MILPIIAYGHPVLRTVSADIGTDHPELDKLIDNMWETLYASNGVGLAAPQVNRAIRLFLVDSMQLFRSMEPEERSDYPGDEGIKAVFINAKLRDQQGAEWAYNEGCLSIPRIREDVYRPSTITVDYLDERFQPHTKTFTGITARIIQHEYDHIEGRLFIDRISPLKRKLLRGKLTDISKGRVSVDYKMQFP